MHEFNVVRAKRMAKIYFWDVYYRENSKSEKQYLDKKGKSIQMPRGEFKHPSTEFKHLERRSNILKEVQVSLPAF